MENIQNNMTGYSSGDNKKTVLITVIAGVAVLGALIWWVNGVQAPQQVQINPTSTPDAETASINQDVDSISVEGLNAEFDAIDKDLQGL